ncbi:MAG TPA: DUF1015 domain-containing protein [Verrucomicrobiae bacterium]|nr:DUF1015 domain-containing protein [Verrucomicrobiae bacterium]
MADIRPFRAIRYNPEKVKLGDVLTQPYDKITPAMQERYYAASPYNLIPVEKGKKLPGDSADNNVYTRAAKTVEEWLGAKILVQDAQPGIYIYTQEFTAPGTRTKSVRQGLIAAGRVEDYDAKVVFRHERTLSGPKADRIELLRRTRLQTGQLFLLYDDPARKIEEWIDQATRTSAPLEMTDEYGVAHRMWPVFDREAIATAQKELGDKKLVIADGHHRYETALQLRNEAREKSGKTDREAASEFAMMTFVNMRSPGLVILPTHRLLRNAAGFELEKFRKQMADYFDWASYPFANAGERSKAYADFQTALRTAADGRAIGVYAGGGAFHLLRLRKEANLKALLPDVSEAQRELDVVLLHRLALEKGLGITPEAVAAEKSVGYEREMDAAISAVDRGEAQAAFLINPARIEQVMEIALGGDVLPQKSTDFYPKLMSGIANYRGEGKAEK